MAWNNYPMNFLFEKIFNKIISRDRACGDITHKKQAPNI